MEPDLCNHDLLAIDARSIEHRGNKISVLAVCRVCGHKKRYERHATERAGTTQWRADPLEPLCFNRIGS